MELVLTSFVLLVATCVSCSAFTLSKPKALSVDCSSHGDNKEFKHRLKHRNNAEDQATIWLFRNEELNIHFDMPKPAVIDVLDIRYSNDGGVDSIALSLDGMELGQFKTRVHFGWGDLWNMFESSGPIGGPHYLEAGEHKLTISILDSDLYGVEIDYIRFNVHGSTMDHLHKDQFECVHNPGHRKEVNTGQQFRRNNMMTT